METFGYYSYTCDRLLRKVGGTLSLVQVETEDKETGRKFLEIVAICEVATQEPQDLKSVFPDLRCVGKAVKLVSYGDNGMLGKTLASYTELPFLVKE